MIVALCRGIAAPARRAGTTRTRTLNSLSEQEAIARAREGDPDAFAAVVRAYAGPIHAHVHRILRRREDAEDAAQETFLRAYRYLATYDEARPFRNWLYRIATNVALNMLRGRSRGEAAPLDPERPPAAATVAPEAERRLAREDAWGGVEAEIDAMPPRVAALLRLRYREGMAIREAAEAVGMSEAAAKMALSRARRTLRERLVESDDGDM
jgi:RNA polymerase sigma-70 factor (ECF subfamily)